MTNLETVAAQRDELSMKLRAMAIELEAANAEIARLRAAAPVAVDAPPPAAAALLAVAPIPASLAGVVRGGYVEPVSLGESFGAEVELK